jgi:competence protein ComEC
VIVFFGAIGIFFSHRFHYQLTPLLIFFTLISVGIGWGHIKAERVLEYQLPESLNKHVYVIKGFVRGPVNRQANRLSFDFDVESFETQSHTTMVTPNSYSLDHLRLSWYAKVGSLSSLHAGDHWQLLVRLKQPRGLTNFSGFDYQGMAC